MGFFKYLVSFLSSQSALTRLGTHSCRCLAGDACWPGADEFSSLAAKVSRPLIYPVPFASVCHPSSPHFADDQCAEALDRSSDAIWRADQVGALQNVNFQTYIHENGTVEGCYLDSSLSQTCDQGSLPTVGIDARNAQDIQQAVLFVRKHNLQLVIKNSGHDFLGKNKGRGGFLLWTHLWKDMSYDEHFIPQGAPEGSSIAYQAFTFSAGVQWGEAYTFANQYKRVLVGGVAANGSVGVAGGWIMGGGHGMLSPSFGLGADNTLQLTVVLAGGSHVTANAYHNADLYWALRGGGAGTYGIITSITYKSYPSFPVTSMALAATLDSPKVAKEVLTKFMAFNIDSADAGWGGHSAYVDNQFNMHMIAPNISLEVAQETFEPFAQYISAATDGNIAVEQTYFDSYYDWFYQNFVVGGPSYVGLHLEVASRLIPQSLLRDSPDKIADAMLSFGGFVGTFSVAGGAVSRADPSTSAVHPAWRSAGTFLLAIDVGTEGKDHHEFMSAEKRVRNRLNTFDSLVPDSATYSNEASLYEEDFKKTFFGSNYPTLEAIRKKYDPQSLFVVPTGVGSDEWDEKLVCRLNSFGKLLRTFWSIIRYSDLFAL